MNNPSPRFTGLFIPVEILENSELTLLEQMLLSWIDALYCEKSRGCYASNEYFAKRLKVKENTVAKALTSLRQKKFIEDVSFDGRVRIVRAKIASYVEKCQSNAALDLNPTPIGFKSNPELDENPNPSYIRDKSIYKSIDTLCIPHRESASPHASKDAGEIEEAFRKTKKSKPSLSFSEPIKLLAEKMVDVLKRAHPVYRLPDNLDKFMQAVQLMLEKDKQNAEIILETFEWACNDIEQRGDFKGWQAIICTNKRKGKASSPAEIFRHHFSTIYSQMKSHPPRKFAPSSNDSKSLEKMKEWAKGAL